MAINLISKIKPKNAGAFPVYEDVDGYGGFQTRDSISDRNSIPSLNRKIGMLVYVRADGNYYTLSGGIADINWTVVSLGGRIFSEAYVDLLNGSFPVSDTTFTVIGATNFDKSILPSGTRTIKLQVLLETTSPLATAQLYNYTAVAVVTSSTLTTTSLTPVLLTTGDLSSNLASGAAIYQIQVKMNAGGVSDKVTCTMARLVVTWS